MPVSAIPYKKNARRETMSRTAKMPEVQNDGAVEDVVQSAPEVPKEKYYRMRFHAKSHPNDEDNVILSVNGETIVVERQKEVVLPERYKVCADNARSPQFRQLPNQTRKIVGEVMTFPFDLLGEGTEAEYMKMKSEGTKATRDSIAKESTAL